MIPTKSETRRRFFQASSVISTVQSAAGNIRLPAGCTSPIAIASRPVPTTSSVSARITRPALFSVALMDTIVLPSSVFAAYNRLRSTDRDIVVYPFNGHEGGQVEHWARQARWLATRI